MQMRKLIIVDISKLVQHVQFDVFVDIAHSSSAVCAIQSWPLYAVNVAQVEELDATARAGGLFNQPQFMALKEMLQRTLATLDNMPQPQGAARAARRAARDKAASAADKLEGVRRTVMGGASPTASTPLGRSSMGPFGSASRQQATYDALGGEAGYAASSTAGSVYGGYGDRSHSRQASWAGAGGQLQGEGSAPSSLLAEEYSGGLQQQATRVSPGLKCRLAANGCMCWLGKKRPY